MEQEIEVKEVIFQKCIFEITEKSFLQDKKSFKFRLSVEQPDRSNDIVRVNGIGLNNYLKNPVVLFNHDQSILPIGKGVELEVVGDALIGEIEFHTETELAKEIANLVEKGYMSAVSIGFLPLKITSFPITEEMRQTGKYYPYTNSVRIIEEAELIEFSIVAVPANQDALITMSIEDKTVDLQLKIGATLSKNNLEKLKQAVEILTDVIMSAEGPTEVPIDVEKVSEITKTEDEEFSQGHSIEEEVIVTSKHYVTDEYLEEILSKIKY